MGTTRRGADMRTRSSAIGVAGPVTVAAMVVALALALDAPAVRMVAALAGCLVLPGLGWARRLRLRDLGDTIALTVVLSLSITAVVATGHGRDRSVVAGRPGWRSSPRSTALGFVPVRAVVVRAGVVVLGRPARDAELPLRGRPRRHRGRLDRLVRRRPRPQRRGAPAPGRRGRGGRAGLAGLVRRDPAGRGSGTQCAVGRRRPDERGAAGRPADTGAPNPAELVTSKGTRD